MERMINKRSEDNILLMGQCNIGDNIHQTITISINGFSAVVTMWNNVGSFPVAKIHLQSSFVGNDMIMSDGNGTVFVLTAINIHTQPNINGYYVLLGKSFGRFEVCHHIAAHPKL